MNPSDPLENAPKKSDAPNLPQQDINAFLNEALKKARAAGKLANLSGDLSQRIASMTFAADWSRQLLRSFEPPKSPFQKVIDEAARSAAVHRNLSSLTDAIAKATASMRTSAELNREMLRSIQLPKGSIQLAIDAAQKAALKRDLSSLTDGIAKAAASIRTSRDISREMLRSIQPPKSSFQVVIDVAQKATLKRDLERIREQTGAISKLVQMYSSPAFGSVSQAIQQAMSAHHIWQSASITDFASRILQEGELRRAVIARLESESFPEGRSEGAQFSPQQVLEAIECGIEESGIATQSADILQSINRMFSWWEKLPPDLRGIVIGIIIMILHLTLEHSVLKDQPTPPMLVNQQVRIVQQSTNNIFVNLGVTADERRQFRVVTKDALPVFRSNRRDSGKIGTLTAAQVVTVKFQKRNWTQVEWRDPDSEEMRAGWVFTRYLKRP